MESAVTPPGRLGRGRGWTAFLCFALLWTGCGSETAVVLEVDLSKYRIVEQIDELFVQLTVPGEGELGELGEYFALRDGQRNPTIKLYDPQRTPNSFDLVIVAYKNRKKVSESAPVQISFEQGAVVRVQVSMP